jgi:LPS export ABC transporter protein LptC
MGVMVLLSCENDMEAVKALATIEDTKVDVADSLRMVYTENGIVRAVVTAGKILKWNPPDNKTEFTEGLTVTFFQEGKQVSVVTAEYGVNDEKLQEMKVSGNVIMENNRDEVLKTASLTWDEKNKRIRADGGLSVRTPYEVAYGTGLDSDEDFSNYTIQRIRGIFSVDDDNGFRQ